MSSKNGDKARFGRQRKRKLARRLATQKLKEELAPSAAKATAPDAPPTA